MALTVGTDTYESLADIQTWNTARGYTGTITEFVITKAPNTFKPLHGYLGWALPIEY